jgi:hypothetical protein
MTIDETVKVKGSPVRSLQRFIEAELTPAQREEIFKTLPPDFAARFRSPILATEMIPVYLLNRVTVEAAKIKGEPLDTFARRAGREAAGDAVKGIYRFFAMILTPPALLLRASQMWSSLYSRGELRVDNQTDRSARLRLVNYPSETANCLRITGWIERMAEMTGSKNIEVTQTQCFARGAPHCEWMVKWA